LFAADGRVFGVGQGALSLGGGFQASGAGASGTKGHPTVALLTEGVLVEREVPVSLGTGGVISVALNQPDFTTAERIAQAVNQALGRSAARPVDAGTVNIALRGNS